MKTNKEKNIKMKNQSKIIKFVQKFLLFILIIILLYTLIDGVAGMWKGFHNIDIAFNGLLVGVKNDVDTLDRTVSLVEYYKLGVSQILRGLSWVSFDVILAFILGYALRKETQNNYKKYKRH